MCPELKSNKWGHGDTCVTGKRGKKQKEAHNSIIMTTFYFIYFIYLNFFGGKICQFVPTQHTIYIHYCSEFSKKNNVTYFLKNLNLKKGKRKKEREREYHSSSTQGRLQHLSAE
jgi:hypothetical protein